MSGNQAASGLRRGSPVPGPLPARREAAPHTRRPSRRRCRGRWNPPGRRGVPAIRLPRTLLVRFVRLAAVHRASPRHPRKLPSVPVRRQSVRPRPFPAHALVRGAAAGCPRFPHAPVHRVSAGFFRFPQMFVRKPADRSRRFVRNRRPHRRPPPSPPSPPSAPNLPPAASARPPQSRTPPAFFARPEPLQRETVRPVCSVRSACRVTPLPASGCRLSGCFHCIKFKLTDGASFFGSILLHDLPVLPFVKCFPKRRVSAPASPDISTAMNKKRRFLSSPDGRMPGGRKGSGVCFTTVVFCVKLHTRTGSPANAFALARASSMASCTMRSASAGL